MTRAEFLTELKQLLNGLPRDEHDSAMRYYIEYFDEAGEDGETDVLKRLGSPEKVAQQVLSETPAQRKEMGRPRVNIWKIVALTLLSPIWIALLVTAFSLLVGIVATALGLLISLAVIAMVPMLLCISMLGSGFVCMILGLWVVFQSLPTMFLFFGAGLAVTALGMLILRPSAQILTYSMKAVLRFGSWMLKKLQSIWQIKNWPIKNWPVKNWSIRRAAR